MGAASAPLPVTAALAAPRGVHDASDVAALHQKRRLVRHETADEVRVAPQSVELGRALPADYAPCAANGDRTFPRSAAALVAAADRVRIIQASKFCLTRLRGTQQP